MIQLWPVITTITTHQLQLTDQIPIGTVIGAIDVEAGNIEVHCGAFEPQPLDNLRRHHLIQGADIGLKEGIETATEHIIIEVISTDPGPIRRSTGLLAKNCGNMCRVLL